MTTSGTDSVYDIPSRKRAPSDASRLLNETHDDKRLRCEEDHIRDAEARFEDAAAEGVRFLRSKSWQNLKSHSDPGFEFYYAYGNHANLGCYYPRGTTVAEEATSLLICDSPQDALAYFKSNGKKMRRRIKHVAFSVKAVAFGPSQNGNHWKGFCNYIQDHMCVETVMIPMPYDPGPITLEITSDEHEVDVAMNILQCWPTNITSTKTPPQLSQSESSALQRLRHSFDWKILSHLSHSLVSGSFQDVRLVYPMAIGQHIAPSSLKAVQAIHDHSQRYAKEQTRTGLLIGKADKNRMHSQYTFNLIAARSVFHSEAAIGIAKKYNRTESYPRCSLLGLPRELRDRILELATEPCSPKALHVMNYATNKGQKRVYLKPYPRDYLTLRSVSRQIQVEASPFLFKDKTLILACDSGDAYRYLVQIPSDVLKHIRTIRLHELILFGDNRENRRHWPRLSMFMAKQMALREVIVQVPNDPTFADALDNELADGTDSAEEAAALKLGQFQTMIKAWIAFWWPGAKLLMQLLIQGKIGTCIKLRHETKDYLDRCGVKESAGLSELKAIAELRYPYDSMLDESWLKKAAETFESVLEVGAVSDQEAFDWYKELMSKHPDREMLGFDIGIGKDEDGYQVVVLKRKAV